MDSGFSNNNKLGAYIRNNVNQIPPEFLKIYYQNIRGLQSKTNEILCCICLDLTHLMFFLEHHLSESKLDLIHIDNFALGAKNCRKNSKGKC